MALITRFKTPAALRDVPPDSPFYQNWHYFVTGDIPESTSGPGNVGEYYNASLVDVALLGERALTWMAFPRRVLMPLRDEPELTQFINTELNEAICTQHLDGSTGIDFGPWLASIRESLDRGTKTPYGALPGQAGMRVAIRRTLRQGAMSGTPLEDLGVRPDKRHFMTRNDQLNGNVDLIETAGQMLAGKKVRRLTAKRVPSSSPIKLNNP